MRLGDADSSARRLDLKNGSIRQYGMIAWPNDAMRRPWGVGTRSINRAGVYHGRMDMGSPPEFGRDGSNPPVTSVPVNIASWLVGRSLGLFMLESEGLSIKDQSKLLWNPYGTLLLYKRGFSYLSARKRIIANNATEMDRREIVKWPLHAIYDQFWQREDPVEQVPPKSSSEATTLIRVGMSEEHTKELARSLGVTGKGAHLGISAQLSSKSSTKITLSREEQKSRTVTMTNPLDNTYRKFAIWHVVHRISIVAAPSLPSDRQIVCQEAEFVLSNAANVTFVDVARP